MFEESGHIGQKKLVTCPCLTYTWSCSQPCLVLEVYFKIHLSTWVHTQRCTWLYMAVYDQNSLVKPQLKTKCKGGKEIERKRAKTKRGEDTTREKEIANLQN